MIAIVASQDDSLYINTQKNQTMGQVDIDKLYDIKSIQEIIYDHEDNVFYILANKFQGKLGFFLIRVNENNPMDFTFIMKLKDKLDI